MLFNAKDIEQFQLHQPFIDTALVPLANISLSQQKIRHTGSQADFLTSLTLFIERQFKGRLMLMPTLTYLDDMPQQVDLAAWKEAIKQAGFQHIVFITCDQRWANQQSDDNMIWLPAIPLESMDASMKQKILEDQLKLIIPNLTKEWSGQ